MKIQENIALAGYTTFDIGGPARYFVEVTSVQELSEALSFTQKQSVPFYVFGGGSNVVFSDAGYDGLVIIIGIAGIHHDGLTVRIGAGENLLETIRILADLGLSGLEKMAGVPGRVGGAVRGNAGAFGTEIGDFVSVVTTLNTQTGTVEDHDVHSCGFDYRDSIFKKRSELIILEVTLILREGVPAESSAMISATIAQREERHIQDIRSAGSFFVNPVVPVSLQQEFFTEKGIESRDGRVPAGWLLERSGMDQERIGDIQAGEMHANYFINVGGGTADQVVQLASLAKMRVRNCFDVQMKEEVQLVGF